MADKWVIRGVEYGNCNCSWGCPCQFGAPTTHGHCEAVVAGHIGEGSFNDIKLDGLDWALLLYWPGEIAQGNGTEQAIVDERADERQREALRRILLGESTSPGATHVREDGGVRCGGRACRRRRPDPARCPRRNRRHRALTEATPPVLESAVIPTSGQRQA